MNGVDARHVRQVPGVDDPLVVELADGRVQQACAGPGSFSLRHTRLARLKLEQRARSVMDLRSGRLQPFVDLPQRVHDRVRVFGMGLVGAQLFSPATVLLQIRPMPLETRLISPSWAATSSPSRVMWT